GQRICILKSRCELIHQVTCAGIAVRLEDHMDFVEATLFGRSQSRANFGGMMAVVIDDADSTGLAAQLKTPIHSAESIQGCADLLDAYIESNADCDGSGCV